MTITSEARRGRPGSAPGRPGWWRGCKEPARSQGDAWQPPSPLWHGWVAAHQRVLDYRTAARGALMVGRTPPSAAGPLAGQSRATNPAWEERDEGVPRGPGGPPHRFRGHQMSYSSLM